jgi:hypothetical protein
VSYGLTFSRRAEAYLRRRASQEAYFTLGEYWVYVDAPAVPPDILADFVDAWIRDHRSPYAAP